MEILLTISLLPRSSAQSSSRRGSNQIPSCRSNLLAMLYPFWGLPKGLVFSSNSNLSLGEKQESVFVKASERLYIQSTWGKRWHVGTYNRPGRALRRSWNETLWDFKTFKNSHVYGGIERATQKRPEWTLSFYLGHIPKLRTHRPNWWALPHTELVSKDWERLLFFSNAWFSNRSHKAYREARKHGPFKETI